MKHLLLLGLLALPSSAFGESTGFLTPSEESKIYHEETSDHVLVMAYDDFANGSESPAVIVGALELYGHDALVIQRGGRYAVLADTAVLNGLDGIQMQAAHEGPKVVYCSSMCWDDAIGEGFSGMMDGFGKGAAGGGAVGGGIGWYVAGPPGAGAGAVIGGAAGAVGGATIGGTAGAIKGFNQCQKDKAVICGDDKTK